MRGLLRLWGKVKMPMLDPEEGLGRVGSLCENLREWTWKRETSVVSLALTMCTLRDFGGWVMLSSRLNG